MPTILQTGSSLPHAPQPLDKKSDQSPDGRIQLANIARAMAVRYPTIRLGYSVESIYVAGLAGVLQTTG